MIKASLMQAGCEIDFQRQADIGGGLPPTSPKSKMPNSDLQPLVWSNGLLRPRPHEVSLPVIEYPNQESFGARSAYSL
jgi:hypothetical protein